MLSRKQKGNIAEAEACIHFIKNGYELYSPANDNSKYDLLATKDGTIFRVSVKYCSTRHASGSWKVSMSNVSRRASNTVKVDKFDNEIYDLIAVYLAPIDRLVVLPAEMATPNILTISEVWLSSV